MILKEVIMMGTMNLHNTLKTYLGITNKRNCLHEHKIFKKELFNLKPYSEICYTYLYFLSLKDLVRKAILVKITP